jgi:ATP-binding cassette subfamily B protein
VDDAAAPFSNGDQNGEQATVLHDVSFKLEAGRVLGVLGRTGSGKTTLARLLFRLYDPRQGEVCLGGVNLRQTSLEELASKVGLVTQDVQLFEASLRDNITFFDPGVSDERVLAALETLGLRPWLERLPAGLDTLISGATLSAGEAQLVALARLLLKDPGLVILDEASSRLDPMTEAMLGQAWDKLTSLKAAATDGRRFWGGQPTSPARRTTVIIAHRLSTVERADDILILERGRIVEYGPRHLLAADPRSCFAALRRTGLEEVLV